MSHPTRRALSHAQSLITIPARLSLSISSALCFGVLCFERTHAWCVRGVPDLHMGVPFCLFWITLAETLRRVCSAPLVTFCVARPVLLCPRAAMQWPVLEPLSVPVPLLWLPCVLAPSLPPLWLLPGCPVC